MNRRFRRLLTGALGSLALVSVVAAPPALAQDDDDAPYFDVSPTLAPVSPWKQWVAAGLFAAGVLAIAFKNPHRTHLD
jgi:hypothetical protein